jgi:hypothetical protein
MRYATALVRVSDAADAVSAFVARTLERKGGLSGLGDPKPYLMKAARPSHSPRNTRTHPDTSRGSVRVITIPHPGNRRCQGHR